MESVPLADRLRPKILNDVIGQQHLVGTDGILRKLLEHNFLPSIIFWGPPGCGKTTLAHLLASLSQSYFVSMSAVTATLSDVRSIVKEAKLRLISGKRTVFFLDEIHRFNKAQQDTLLPHVEKGTIIFIGATTENPSFEVIAPLLSRCRVFVLRPLSVDDLSKIIHKACLFLHMKISEKAQRFLLEIANGDARSLITILEIAKNLSNKEKIVTPSDIEEAAQKNMLQYDRAGEEHYNTISAFIKSMRASDVDAALYYLARMVKAGEDPLFIARRMVIFASEDIGVAQPTALVVANAVFDGAHKIGYPEAQILLAHGVVYLSCARKNRSAYDGYMSALHDVTTMGNLPIPLMIRNAPTKLMKELKYGDGYTKYSKESHLPEKIKEKKYFQKV